MAKSSRAVEEIDEAAMLRSIYERDGGADTVVTRQSPSEPKEPNAQSASVEPPRAETTTRRAKSAEYESLFIRGSDVPPARFGKSVYIRKEYHDRISQIVAVIGGREVSLFGYIDNVLAHHFENFEGEIALSFKRKTIFK